MNNVWVLRVLINLRARQRLVQDLDYMSDSSDVIDGEVLIGWQKQAGFPLREMEASVAFAKIPGIITPLVLYFATDEVLPAGGLLILTFEPSIFVRCDFDFVGRGGWRRARRFATGDDYEDYTKEGGKELPMDGTLPSVATCAVSDVERQLVMTFVADMPAGPHCLAALAETWRWWREEPYDGVSLKLVSPYNETVLGAVYDLPGTEVVFGVKMEAPSVAWDPGKTDPLQATAMVTLDIMDPVMDNTPEPRALSRIVVEMPPGYSHGVRSAGDLTIFPPVTPHPKDADVSSGAWGWALNLQPSMVDPGTHSIKFTATAPAEVPALNMWHIHLCEGLCSVGEADDGSLAWTGDVAVTFPVPGVLPRIPPPPPVQAAASAIVLIAAVVRW